MAPVSLYGFAITEREKNVKHWMQTSGCWALLQGNKRQDKGKWPLDIKEILAEWVIRH